MDLKTLDSKPLKDSSKGNYRNVQTNRIIKNTSNKDLIFFQYKDNYLTSPKENFQKFLEINKIPKSNIKILEDETPSSPRSKPRPISPVSKPKKKTFFESVTNFFSRSNNQTCEIGTAGTALFVPNTDDVEDIPDNVISSMCIFELANLEGKAKIVNIKDGDTVDLLFYVKLSDLAKERLKGRDKKNRVPVVTQHTHTGFFSVFSCRFYGIDAAEHNTAQGQLNTILLEDYLLKLNKIVYIKIRKFDKYGRMMADLYSDKEFKDLINTKLVGVNVPELYKILKDQGIKSDLESSQLLCLDYSGDAKDKRFKDLPIVPSNFITREKHRDIIKKYAIS